MLKKFNCSCGTLVVLSDSISEDFLFGKCRVCQKKHVFEKDDPIIETLEDHKPDDETKKEML